MADLTIALAGNPNAGKTTIFNALTGLRPAGQVKSFGYAYGLNKERVAGSMAATFAKALGELCRSGRTAELLKPYGLSASACVK